MLRYDLILVFGKRRFYGVCLVTVHTGSPQPFGESPEMRAVRKLLLDKRICKT